MIIHTDAREREVSVYILVPLGFGLARTLACAVAALFLAMGCVSGGEDFVGELG